MAKKRFNVLNGALKYLGTGEEGDNPVAPAGTALRRFQQVKSGEVDVSYERDEDSKPEELLRVGVNPFGLPPTEANRVLVPLSKRASLASQISAARTAGNLIPNIDGIALTLDGFESAKCVVHIPDASRDDRNARSQLTNLKYYKKGFRSYTFPYGAKTGEDKEQSVRTSILGSFAETANYGVSFKSEKL